ncbi:MFS transporter [Bacillus sp. FJAT-45350]|uniref:MFS transporter n=1 Tax=Bacillus sp. FJAT-45350 TaxID=2011014 RepID=UPI0015CDCC82|nr:MFS transporter [Bacillus sp. FJAT-45350]
MKIDQQEKLWSKDFVILIICNLLVFVNLHLLVSSFPLYVQEEYNPNAFVLSLVTTFASVAAIGARIYSGRAIQKGSRNTILFVGLAIAIISTIGYYFVQSLFILLLLRLTFGFGFGMTSTAFPTMASNAIPIKRMGEGLGYFGLSIGFALALAPFAGLFLLGNHGFGILILTTLVVLLLIIPLALSVRKLPSPKMESTGKVKIFDKKMFFPFFLNLMLSLTFGGIIAFIALYGAEANIGNVGLFFLLHALAMVTVRPFAGRFYDVKGPTLVLLGGSIFTISSLVTLSLSMNNWMLMLAGLLYGLGYGAIQPTLQAWMIREALPSERGMANGMFLNSIDLGVAGGAVVLGVVASFTGYALMYQLSILFMFIFIVSYLISMKRQKPEEVQLTA